MVYVCRIFKRSLFQNSYLPGDGEEEGDVETREEDQMMFLEPVVIKKANNKNKIELANVCKYTGKQSGIVYCPTLHFILFVRCWCQGLQMCTVIICSKVQFLNVDDHLSNTLYLQSSKRECRCVSPP